MATIVTRSGKGSPLTNTEVDSNFTNLNTDKLELSGGTMSGDIDGNGNKVLFANVYSATSDLPSASTYHGMFAHVHATGKGYFAHAGSWVPLANASDIVTYTVQDGQLSQNNFTNADHTKLNAIEASADVTDTANVVAALTAGTNVSIAANGTISSTDTNTTYSVGDGGLTTNDFTNADHSKLDGIAALANNYTHPNHSGEVTSTADGATVIADNVVDEANLKISNTPTNGYVLTAQSGNTGGLTWAAASGGGADLYSANESSPTAQPSATGTNAIAIGDSAISTGVRTTAFSKSRAAGYDSIAGAILNNTTSYGTTAEGNIAFGEKAKVTGHGSQGIGKLSVTSGLNSMGLGYTATASGLRSYAFGYGATASGTDSVSIGRSVASTANNQVNIGGSTQDVRISETYTLPKVDGSNGQVLTTNGSGVISFATPASGGGGADLYAANESSPTAQPSATGANAIAIGDLATASGANSFSASFNADASGSGAISLGINSVASGSQSVALGRDAKATGVDSSALSTYSRASGMQSAALAINSSSTSYGSSGRYSVAIGNLSKATQQSSIAIGNTAISTTASQIALGGATDTVKISNTYTLPTADGSNGQVMTTNGSGVISFATAGGGSPDLFDESYDGSATKPSASGTNSVAIMQEATTSGSFSLAAGWRAKADGLRSTALGYSLASGSNSLAMNVDNNGIGATGSNSVAICRDTRATATNAIAFGQYNTASHNNSHTFGYNVQSSATNQVSIGGDTQDVRISETYTLPKVDGTASGQVLTTNGSGTVSWAAASGGGGADLYAAETTGSSNPTASGTLAIAIGSGTTVSGNQAVGVGRSSTVAGFRAAAFGGDNIASAEKSLALGFGASSSGTRGVAINGAVTGQDSIAFGTNSYVQSNYATAVGYNADVSGASGTALGSNAQVTASDAVALGNSRAASANSIAGGINQNSTSYGTSGVNTVAFGTQAKATNNSAVSIGQSSIASGYQSAAYGYNAVASGQDSFAGGPTTDATATNSTALGKGAQATHANATSVGYNAATSTTNQVSVGASGYAVKISGNYTLPTADGSNGQVLTTNGSGVISFATAGGGSPDLFADNDVDATAPSATGNNSVAIGPNSEANSADATAFGYRSEAKASKAVAIGEGRAGGASATAISIGTTSTAYGATGVRSIAMGYQAKATGLDSTALSQNSVATATNSIALGKSLASTQNGFAVQINNNTTSYGASGVFGSTAIGDTAKATGSVAFAMGQGSIASGSKSLALGTGATASASNSVAIGYNTTANVADGVAVGGSGKQVKISGNYTLPTADGTSGQVMTTNGSGVISFATAGGGSPQLFDENVAAWVTSSHLPSATGDNAIAMGREATATNRNTIGIGGYAKATGQEAMAFGAAAASGVDSLAMQIGQSQTTYGSSGTQSLAIGVYNRSTATETIAIGRQNVVSHNYSIALGKDIGSTAVSQVSIGGSTQDVRISETYTLPKVDGSNGQVLTTNGSGVISFASAGASTTFGAVGTYGLIGDGNESGGATNYTVGQTIAGSHLNRAYAVYNFTYNTITALSGTWRCMGYGGTGYYGTLWCRVS